MRNLKLALLLLAMLGCSTAAQAHALLEHASPAVGSTVASSPGSVTLYFTEKLEPKFSGGDVRGPGGARVDRGIERERQRDAARRRWPAPGPLQRDLACALGRHAQNPRKLQLPNREVTQPDTNLLLPLVRGAFVASLFSAFGALLFIRLVAPQGLRLVPLRDADAIEERCLRVVRVSLVAAFFALLALARARSIRHVRRGKCDRRPRGNSRGVARHELRPRSHRPGAGGVRRARASDGVAAAMALCDLLGWRGSLLRFRPGIATPSPWSMARACCSMREGLHLLAGGAWLGGLLPLLILVRDAPPKPAAETLRRFSKLATFCVIAIAGTACFQGWILGGGVAGLIGTAYGWVLLLKAALFAALLGLAVVNRFRLTPAMERRDAQLARWALLRTIAAETVLGLMVVLAAGVLSGLEPGMHAGPVLSLSSQCQNARICLAAARPLGNRID